MGERQKAKGEGGKGKGEGGKKTAVGRQQGSMCFVFFQRLHYIETL
jgi:hypothetical protein